MFADFHDINALIMANFKLPAWLQSLKEELERGTTHVKTVAGHSELAVAQHRFSTACPHLCEQPLNSTVH